MLRYMTRARSLQREFRESSLVDYHPDACRADVELIKLH